MRMSHCWNFPRKHTPILSTHHGNSQKTQDGTVHAMRLGSTRGLPGPAFIVAVLSRVFSSSRLYYSSTSQWEDACVTTEQEWRLSSLPAACRERRSSKYSPGMEDRGPGYNPDSAFPLYVAMSCSLYLFGPQTLYPSSWCTPPVCLVVFNHLWPHAL